MAEQLRRPFGVGGTPSVPEGEETAAAAEPARHSRAGVGQDIGAARQAARPQCSALVDLLLGRGGQDGQEARAVAPLGLDEGIEETGGLVKGAHGLSTPSAVSATPAWTRRRSPGIT